MQPQVDVPILPPLAPPEASDDERARAIVARMVARYGAPTPEDHRRAYAGFGVEWPGDEEIRRRHIAKPSYLGDILEMANTRLYPVVYAKPSLKK